MAVSFPKARSSSVAPGRKITSTQIARLADAFNARLRSGLGDPTWRIAFYQLALFRQIRISDGFLFPSNAEFFEVYQQLKPNVSTWPTTGPGEPAGANLANIMAAYVFGSEALDIYDEASRLTEPSLGGMPIEAASDRPDDLWTLGKLQRGAYDPNTGAMAAPAFDAARSYAAIRWSWFSPHGNAYGGYLPTPEVIYPACEDPDGDSATPPPTNWEIKFTALRDGLADVTYPGTCQPAPLESYDLHVAAIGYTPWAYYVLRNNGTVDVLPTTDYVEGPYTGPPKLRKTWGAHLERVFSRYVADFRGVDQAAAAMTETVPKPGKWNARAFDFQRFIRSQYLLAPARGEEIGDSVQAYYPTRLVPYGLRQGVAVEPVTPEPGFVVAALLAKADSVGGSTRFELRTAGEVVGRFALSARPGGEQAICVLDPAPTTPVELVLTSANQAAGLVCEFAELMDYKPHAHDWLLALRVGAARL